ncbi:MAG: TIGR00269 family protein [Candidatus Aenigmatarchaeota archaeon]
MIPSTIKEKVAGKCSNCKNAAIIEMKYVGKRFCKNCFMAFFEKRVRATLGKSKYLDDAKTIAVALSGGKDSITALHLLKNTAKRTNIITITIDGGIKGYDDLLQKNAKAVCKSLGVKHYVYSFKKEFGYTLDDLAKTRPGMCNCGIFRRYLLNKKARELKADKLATGHNLDDEVESILMNYIRGDVEKISRGEGILKHKKFVPRIKPLKRCPENEVALYARLLYPKMKFGLTCKYRKAVLRYNIKKLIDELETLHPGTKFQIFEGNERIRSALQKSSKSVGEPNLCRKCGEICANDVCQTCKFTVKIREAMKKK